MAAIVEKHMRDFRVIYSVDEGQVPINIRCRTESLELLHRILVGMINRRKPVGQWHELVVHETLEDGSVKEFGKSWLALYDRDMVPLEQPAAEDNKLGDKLTLVITRTKKKYDTITSSNICWRNHAYQ